MNRVPSLVFRMVAMLALWLGSAGRAGAGPLNPRDFAPIGPFPTAAGTYTFDTIDATLRQGSGGFLGPPLVTGVFYHGIAVFDFSSITVNSGQVFLGIGPSPLALLSRGDININGTIDVSAPPVVNNNLPSPGGPGGFGSSSGPGFGGDGSAPLNGSFFSAPGGGGFGGRGGNGGLITPSPNGSPIIHFAGGAPGGAGYGNLAISFQGGSGGGSLFDKAGFFAGGGGGGAIEVGAVGGITIGGSILADGASGYSGGSGGGIFLHGDSVALTGLLSAAGGSINIPPGEGGGGGGGGGRVAILAEPGGFTGDVSGINVSGGGGGTFSTFAFSASGEPGVFTLIPEPASLVLLGVGMLGVLGLARRAGRHVAS
jgi:hypothetical protein